MADISFNINDCVKVKLTSYGKQIYIKEMGIAPRVDDDGYTIFQLHWLMHLYGNHIIPGSPCLPFKTNILIINKEN